MNTSLRVKRGYATTLVDLHNHKVFDVTLGRSEASLKRYLQRLSGREQVKVVVMDLSETYRSYRPPVLPQGKDCGGPIPCGALGGPSIF